MSRTPRHPRPQRSAEAGFSLLEVVVSMTLIGLITAFAIGGVRVGTRVWEMNAVGEETIELGLVTHHLRRWIEGAHAYKTIQDGDPGPVGFIGERGRIVFAVAEDGRVDRPGLYQYEIFVDDRPLGDGEIGPVLLLRRAPLIEAGAFPAPSASDERALGTEIAAAAFSYYGTALDGAEASWRADWIDRESLPHLVQVDLTLKRGPIRSRRLIIPIQVSN